MKKPIILIILLCMYLPILQAKDYVLTSPDRKISVTVSDTKELTWSVSFNGETLLRPSRIAMTVKESNTVLGINSSAQKVNRKTVDETFQADIPTKFKNIRDHYNEMNLTFKDNFVVTFPCL